MLHSPCSLANVFVLSAAMHCCGIVTAAETFQPVCRDIDDLQQVLMINVVGTFAVTKAFLPMLKRGNKKTIVNISSDAACLTLMYSMIHAKDGMDAGMGLGYKASKCAVNMGKPFGNACSAGHSNAPDSAVTHIALHLSHESDVSMLISMSVLPKKGTYFLVISVYIVGYRR